MNDFFYIQWHLTDRCNLRCKHCYQSSYETHGELSLSELKDIYYKIEDYISKNNLKGSIQLTGGEPFARKDFLDILEFLKEKKKISYGIMTNGTILSEKLVKKIKDLGVDFVQVSLEGIKNTNDSIRGKGTFEKIVKAISLLKNNAIGVTVSFTSSKLNYKEYEKIIDLCSSLDVNIVWTDRYVPCNQTNVYEDKLIEPNELKNYYKSIINIKKKSKNQKMDINTNRSLFQLIDKDSKYICSAGKGGITILPNGDVYPCRRLPIKIGNIKEQTLFEVMLDNPKLDELLKKSINNLCFECSLLGKCFGGAKCIAYAYFGDFRAPDPQCWKLFRTLPKKNLKYKIINLS
jgi:radical SAM protein with 4Fe4S-binding SPASM domain